MVNIKVGVLALQGSIQEHINVLKEIGVEYSKVQLPEDLDDVDGLIIPGGESTTIGKLMWHYGLDKKIIQRHKSGMPIYGTCAGAIILAKEVEGSLQPKLGLMNIAVKRNAYGRQIESFEADINIKGFDKQFKGIFIRAPILKSLSGSVEILSKYDDNIIMAKENNILVSTFHPELTDDTRVHEYFIGMIKNKDN